ncbi:MAG TPA: FAD-binding oxidoreductase [Thermomicrobiales bacterium]|jgi:glycine/D-amino acid oxidase-like deaminating enzyme
MGGTRGQGPDDRRQPDVIVVGGGVVGCSIAYRLAKARRRVLLLEKRGLAAGASGRNGGVLGVGSSLLSEEGRAVYALTSANLALVQQLPDEIGVDFELRQPGTLTVATTPEHADHLVASVERQRAAGLDVAWLDRASARSLMPTLTEAIVGAEYTRNAGHLWPFALVNGFAAAAKRLGATIRTGVAVDRLLRDGDRVTGVVARGEAIETDDVVLATNAYTPLLLPELPAGAIVPARGQILVTQPVPPVLPHPFGTNFDKEYGRQTAGGQILCGGFRRLDEDEGLGHYEERVSPAVLNGIAGCLTTLFPRLAGIKVVRAWAGIMGFTADGLPLIGRASWAPGLTIAAGFNGGGFSWGTVVGVVVADLLGGREAGFDLRPFRPDRFATGGTAWTNPFTAGERSAIPRSGAIAATR